MPDVVCPVCMHHCHLKEHQLGRCKARRNIDGKSVAENYGLITSIALDPIEKKPLARFYPGSHILSVGSFGCNLDCPFCQNACIAAASIADVKTQLMPPDSLAELAEQLGPRGNIGVAYTYNEPLVGYEYVRDAAKAVHARGMKNVAVTNGSVTLDVLEELLPYIDAYNIDLKGFTQAYYHRLGGELNIVLDFISAAVAHAHVELTTLIVPGQNDSPDEMRALSKWVAELDPAIPLHITRFFPHKNMLDTAPTDVLAMRELAEIAREKLHTVLLGNV